MASETLAESMDFGQDQNYIKQEVEPSLENVQKSQLSDLIREPPDLPDFQSEPPLLKFEPKSLTPVLKLNQDGLLQGFPEHKKKRKRESDENQIFSCVQCDYTVGSSRSLRRHIEAKHIGLRKNATKKLSNKIIPLFLHFFFLAVVLPPV